MINLSNLLKAANKFPQMQIAPGNLYALISPVQRIEDLLSPRITGTGLRSKTINAPEGEPILVHTEPGFDFFQALLTSIRHNIIESDLLLVNTTGLAPGSIKPLYQECCDLIKKNDKKSILLIFLPTTRRKINTFSFISLGTHSSSNFYDALSATWEESQEEGFTFNIKVDQSGPSST